jgi:hypothetical protein
MKVQEKMMNAQRIRIEKEEEVKEENFTSPKLLKKDSGSHSFRESFKVLI